MNKAKLALVALSVAALGAAGVGTAFASTHSPAVRPVHAHVVQAPTEAPGTETADAPGGPDVQQGDQNAPGTVSSTDQADSTSGTDQADSDKGSADQAEAAGSEKAGASDGPGGYADPAGNDNSNIQQQGEN